MPAWAHDRRALIVDRLRKSGAILYEQDDEVTTVLSPGATFRIECISEYDDRAPAWDRLRVVATADERELVYLPLHGTHGLIEFPAPGIVHIPLQSRYGPKHQLRLDLVNGTFALDNSPQQEKLETLFARLQAQQPMAAAPAPSLISPASRAAQWLLDSVMVMIGLIFVAGGLWMSLTGHTLKDRLVGILGVLFFGACAVVAARGLFRRPQLKAKAARGATK
jgi:hypothetical protein